MRPAQYIKLNISIQTISVPLTNLLLIYSEDPPLRVWICESTYVCMGNHLNPAGGPIALSSIVSTPIPALYAVRLVMLVSMCASAPPALPFALGAGVPLRLLCLVSGLSFSFFFRAHWAVNFMSQQLFGFVCPEVVASWKLLLCCWRNLARAKTNQVGCCLLSAKRISTCNLAHTKWQPSSSATCIMYMYEAVAIFASELEYLRFGTFLSFYLFNFPSTIESHEETIFQKSQNLKTRPYQNIVSRGWQVVPDTISLIWYDFFRSNIAGDEDFRLCGGRTTIFI